MIRYQGHLYRATARNYFAAEIFAGDQHIGFLIAKTEKRLQQEAEALYRWTKEDHDRYSPDEELGPLRVESGPVAADQIHWVVEEWIRWGDTEWYLEDAMAEFEEKGVLQA